MVAMRMSPDEWNPEGDFSAYCISKDAGATWSRRYAMGTGANMDADWSYEPEEDGRIWHLNGWLDTYPPGQNQDFHLTLTKWSLAARGVSRIERNRKRGISRLQPDFAEFLTCTTGC